MISPDTPAGAEVICIDDSPGPYGDGGLKRGALYTVARVVRAIGGGHVVLLEEIAPWQGYAPPWGLLSIGFELKRFRYLDIPGSLTRLLQAAGERERASL